MAQHVMIKIFVLFLALIWTVPAVAQQPFDMSTERPDEALEELPHDPMTPLPSSGPIAPPEPARTPMPVQRRILSEGNLFLSGESAVRNWVTYLTATQASAAASLQLAYRNAVVVAPESSMLRVVLNNSLILEKPIRSADDFEKVDVELPEGLLRPGRNDFSISTHQRHRTDCTVASTYELWSEIDASQTFLNFEEIGGGSITSIGDLRALAPDAEGRIRVEIIVPALERSNFTAELMRLVQAIVLQANLPGLHFDVVRSLDAGEENPALRVLLGSSGDLAALHDQLELSNGQGPQLIYLNDDVLGAPTLVVTGDNRQEWTASIDQLAGLVERPSGSRTTIVTESWSYPNAALVTGSNSLSFAELGIASQQFSGRRYVRSFNVGIPSDFYASAYGEARLLLDMAFSAAVRPGSSINVYVNGNIAATMPLTQTRGAVLDRMPIDVTMRHFKPGLNEITLEAQLLTEQDEICSPGATADDTPRFAIFDTSQFVVPSFARIGQYPNLAATSGTGYPYNIANGPVSLFLNRENEANLSAAANMAARVAFAGSRLVEMVPVSSADAARGNHALFVAPVNALPQGVLAHVGVSEDSRSTWTGNGGTTMVAPNPQPTTLDDWRRDITRFDLSGIEEWFSRTFGITSDMMRFRPRQDELFQPDQDTLLLVGQGLNPTQTGVWTVLTAPDEARLREGTGAINRQGMWGRLAGHLFALEADLETSFTRPATSVQLVQSQPPSMTNYRLITANWLSANLLSYSLLLIISCLLLGLTTSALLKRLGR